METNRKKAVEGHRQRVKDKFLKTDFDNWADYEVLEFALFFIIPRKDTKIIAKNLLEKFGSLKDLLNSDYDTLVEAIKDIEGIRPNAAYFIRFLRAFSIKYSEIKMVEKKKLSSPNEVITFLRNSIGTLDIEKMYAIYLNASNRVLGFEIISEGVAGRSAVYPSLIAKYALNKDATRSVIIAHNHPGGVCKPSQNDIIATEAIQKALKTIEVVLLDHIIVTNSDYYSFKDNGLI